MATRIPPVLDADGVPQHIDPPSGGAWVHDADGGLIPVDAGTAERAGLDWPAPDTQEA